MIAMPCPQTPAPDSVWGSGPNGDFRVAAAWRGKCHVTAGYMMTALQASAQKQLRQFVEQIERLEEEKKALAADIRDKYAEAKAVGFDVKALRQIVRLRKKSAQERQEEESMLEVYMHALGMLDDGSEPSRKPQHLVAAE